MLTGDSTIISGLFRSYGAAVTAFLVKKGARQQDAEDLTQETFIRAQRVTDWNGIENEKAYLQKIALNLLRDQFRHKQRSRAGGYEADLVLETVDFDSHEPSPEDLAIIGDKFRHLCQAVESLPPKIRRVMVLTKFQNLSYSEAGKVIGISHRTVEKHVAKGIVLCLRHMQAISRGMAGNKVIGILEQRRIRAR